MTGSYSTPIDFAIAFEKSASTPNHSPLLISIQLSGGMLKVPTRMKPRSLICFRRSAAVPETDSEASTITLTRTRKHDRVKVRNPCIFVLPFFDYHFNDKFGSIRVSRHWWECQRHSRQHCSRE